jgi:ATP-dependent DNA helicase PIF1
MSLDCVKVDISRVFEHGQAYVALSRARTLDRLVVTNFSPEAITADPVALRFYRDLREV